ncbi:hypothetical protein [Streptomyces lonarensis]|uniref:Uncharacterized protein n=1 Tax=Streptomyces lonarensis TaxID=700599 RepID=A0A7X6D436_9ACTN|nr:hypothetical protein [Streptomyces lonarensis]NJQ07839.1 hypothetical protein [Streptomyces lonarensis]
MRTAEQDFDAFLANAAIPLATTRADLEASRRRIEERLAATLRQRYAPGVRAPRADGPLADGAAARPMPAHHRAGEDLRQLCTLVVRDAKAAASIAGLVNSVRIEPDGALVFACLLHLADRTDGAQFWWQFSAGAGRGTSAVCLHLLHLQRGEHRDAGYWAAQVAALGQEAPWFVHDMLRAHAALGDRRAAPATPPALAAAIRRLDVATDQDFGPVPQPDPALAAQLTG